MFDFVEMRYVMPILTDAGDEILLNFHECMILYISFNYFEVDPMSSGKRRNQHNRKAYCFS